MLSEKNSNGYLYRCISNCIYFIYYKLCTVEIFKAAAKKFVSVSYEEPTPTQFRIAATHGIDFFIAFKWALIFLFWYFELSGTIYSAITWYLIVTNTFIYFYHHVWGDQKYSNAFSHQRMQRRFLNTILAISFSIFCYAYLYAVTYPESTTLPLQSPNWHYLYFSTITAFTYSDPIHQLKGDIGRLLCATEVINSVTFLTIIISNSLPSPQKENES